jgi:hypothetical protein
MRCVQCGDIVDAVILRNRRLTKGSPTVHTTAATGRSAHMHAAA